MSVQRNDCPHAEALSALVDGELSASEREEITAHAAACPVCGAMLRQFAGLRNTFSSIGDADPGVDIAALVEPQLPPRQPARAPRARRLSAWQLGPMGLGAAGVLAPAFIWACSSLGEAPSLPRSPRS